VTAAKTVGHEPFAMKRLYSLDALRGVAALSVVLWHWQHFYCLTGDWQEGWRREAQPFYPLLKPFYLQGWAAVDLFFALSGFVFFWLYSAAIAERKAKAWPFALKRFSRLYPLQFLTVLAVAALQFFFRRTTGGDFIFPAADWGRFSAHLALAQQWLPPSTDQTFNGPAWTVSIEVGMYVLFFALCRKGFSGPKSALAISLLGVPLIGRYEFIARGLMGFFLGGFLYFVVVRLQGLSRARAWSSAFAIAAMVGWGLAAAAISYSPLHDWVIAMSSHLAAVFGPLDDQAVTHLFLVLYIYTLIPLTVVALALGESRPGARAPGRLCRSLARLGDISYSTYMLHFPLQLACVLLALHFGFGTELFEQPLTLIGFTALLIGLGAVCWWFFELPAQRTLRAVLVPSRFQTGITN
jgi:peptidoglycan/LPS O-acetylase OafA/YrhL